MLQALLPPRAQRGLGQPGVRHSHAQGRQEEVGGAVHHRELGGQEQEVGEVQVFGPHRSGPTLEDH